MQRSDLTLIFPLLILLIFPGFAFSQDLSTRLSLNVRNERIDRVLDRISGLTSVRFSYNPMVIPVAKKVTVKASGEKLSSILDQILIPIGIQYQMVENQIVLTKSSIEKRDTRTGPAVKGSGFTISGFVHDKRSGETLIGANVRVSGSTLGAVANGYGFYSLSLPPGSYTLAFSYIGYKSEIRTIRLDQHLPVNIELSDDSLEMSEVEVLSGDENFNIRTGQMSDVSFSQRSLGKLPGFGGNPDIIRALQAVPGIQSFGDGSSRYFVRGGNSDQNMLLIDDVAVYNPSHLFGFFSAFSPDAINSVQVYKGDFPSRFGGRLSSVIDIKAREGNSKRFEAGGNIGPYASNLTLEGPIVREKSSFLVSGRISTLNWINQLDYVNNSFGFQFFDINAKLNYQPSRNNRFFLTFYYGQDDFSRYNSVEINSYGIGWSNLAAAGRWNHLFSNKLFSNTVMSYSRYRYSLNLPQQTSGYWQSEVANWTLKSDFTWYLNPDNTIRAGLSVSSHLSDPGNVGIENGGDPGEVPEVSRYHSAEYALHFSNEQHLGRKWSLRYGIRLPVWQDLGPAKVYYFDANHQVIDTVSFVTGELYSTVFSPEPRVNVQYMAGQHTALKGSYSRNTQFLQLLSNSISPFNSLEVWAPCGPNVLPQKSDQVSLGVFQEVDRQKFLFSVEGYYKWFHDRLDYKDHPNLLFNTLIEGELRFGSGRSYGVELMARKLTGKLTGWMGYTWSRALVSTPGINGDSWYPADYDRPHHVVVHLGYDNQKRWQFSANWVFLSGNAFSQPIGFYQLNGYQVPVYGERNGQRMPAYHRLDVMASFMLSKLRSRYQHSLSVTVYNLYGRYNPFSLNFNKIINDKGEFVVPSDLYGPKELVPTWYSVAGIIPSINYQFRFR